jgi:hypothetical protein
MASERIDDVIHGFMDDQPCMIEVVGGGMLNVRRADGSVLTLEDVYPVSVSDGTEVVPGMIDMTYTFNYSGANVHNANEWDNWRPCRDV